MTVIVMHRCKPSLRGLLSRWLLEVRTGVFVGMLSSRVREQVWRLVTRRIGTVGFLAYSDATTEQGLRLIAHGSSRRRVRDFDGLSLMERAKDTSVVST